MGNTNYGSYNNYYDGMNLLLERRDMFEFIDCSQGQKSLFTVLKIPLLGRRNLLEWKEQIEKGR